MKLENLLKKLLPYAFGISLTALTPNCVPPDGPAAGCQVDGDCKGDRICQAGDCIYTDWSP